VSIQDSIITVAAAPPGSAARTVLIDARPETVFAFLADPRQHLVIDGSETIRGTLDAPARLSLGATFGMKMVNPVPYKVTNTVVEFEEGRRIAWRHFGGHTWRYVLEPEADGVRVTETFDATTAKAPWMLRLTGVAKKNADGITKTLTRLKTIAESPAG